MAATGTTGPRRYGPLTRLALAGLGLLEAVLDALAQLGSFATFSVRTVASVPVTLRLYSREMLRQLKDVAWGSGALIVGGGTIGVMVLLSISAGTSLGIEGFNGLEIVGLAPLTGFVSASANTRELAPSSPRWRWPPRWGAGSPPSSGRCASTRRSTRWR